jgi:hypothetical protein
MNQSNALYEQNVAIHKVTIRRKRSVMICILKLFILIVAV